MTDTPTPEPVTSGISTVDYVAQAVNGLTEQADQLAAQADQAYAVADGFDATAATNRQQGDDLTAEAKKLRRVARRMEKAVDDPTPDPADLPPAA